MRIHAHTRKGKFHHIGAPDQDAACLPHTGHCRTVVGSGWGIFQDLGARQSDFASHIEQIFG